MDPSLALLPRAAWPEKPPPSRVRATDAQWELIVKAGVERGMMCRVDENEVFRDKERCPCVERHWRGQEGEDHRGRGEDSPKVHKIHKHLGAIQHVSGTHGG